MDRKRKSVRRKNINCEKIELAAKMQIKKYRKVTFTTTKKSRIALRRWRGTMKDVPCFILGNGPSISDHPIKELLKDHFTIGINRAFQLMDPTILIWQDIELWMTERANLTNLKAIKYSSTNADPRGIAYQFKLMPGPYRIPPNPMVLFGQGSTGPLAFQLAYCLGCSPIILLGYDCKCIEGNTDFYGVNKHHKSHTMPNCKKGLRWINKCNAKTRVINCSENDTLKHKMPLEEAIKICDKLCKIKGRESLVEKLFSKKGQ